mmetsp:Transcript_14298/g.30028  ORF Transcript_14298/g.30028 Transcript_14298/m.30028 type:complete len:86 (-) Transcript_14298:929-1186(-)
MRSGLKLARIDFIRVTSPSHHSSSQTNLPMTSKQYTPICPTSSQLKLAQLESKQKSKKSTSTKPRSSASIFLHPLRYKSLYLLWI